MHQKHQRQIISELKVVKMLKNVNVELPEHIVGTIRINYGIISLVNENM